MWVQLVCRTGKEGTVVICISELIPIDHNITIITRSDAVTRQLSLPAPSLPSSINKQESCLSRVTLLLPLESECIHSTLSLSSPPFLPTPCSSLAGLRPLSSSSSLQPPGVNYKTLTQHQAPELGKTWKCINLDSSLQSKGSSEETLAVSPRGAATSGVPGGRCVGRRKDSHFSVPTTHCHWKSRSTPTALVQHNLVKNLYEIFHSVSLFK